MTVSLRPDQSETVEKVRDALRRVRRVVLCAPTGFGKSQVAAFMAKGAAAKGLTTWITVHRDYLIDQTSATLSDHDIPHGFISSKRECNPYHRVQVVSIDTLRHRLNRLAPPNLLIPDECHHSPSGTWSKILQWAHDARIVGLSATPARLDGRGLDGHFDEIVYGPSVSWLIANGHLSRYRAFAPATPDLTGVHSRAGDYVTADLEKLMAGDAIVGDLVRHYRAIADGMRALYFGVSIAHSERIAATFNAAGIPAVHLDGTSTSQARTQAARSLADGSIKVISNVSLISEGYDLAAQAGVPVTVDVVGLARPTQSLTLYLQAVGRALRPKPYPAIIIDHAGCCMAHGLPDDEREWSLGGVDRKARLADAPPPIRVCEKCYGCFGASTRICPYCGHQNGLTPREVEEIQADLVEADRELIKAAKQREVQRAQSLEDLQRIGASRGYKPGWAMHLWAARKGRRQAARSATDLRADLIDSLTADTL